MTTYNTGNPIGSIDPRDLYDNAENLDNLSLDMVNETYPDRLGRQRKTWYGFEKDVNRAIQNYGYITKDSFEDGSTISLANECLRWKSNGEYYRWDGALPKVVPPGSTPDSTGGIGTGKWVSVGDASLRTELASSASGKGVALVYGAVKKSGDEFTGHVDMPSLTVKSTFGNVIVGDQPVGVPGAVWPLPDSLRDSINVSRLLSNTPFNCHAFSDKTVLSQGTAIDGYGAFDSTVIIYGSHHQDHAHSFQDRVSYRGSNRLDNTYGYYSAPTISGSGTVGDRRGIFINDVSIFGGGTLEQQTGVYLEDLKAASGINVAYQTRQTTGYTFYAPNSARMYHKGAAGFGYDPVQADTNFAIHFRGSAPSTSYYGFLHTDNSGASLGVSQDTAILFIQGGSVRAKIKPQATTLSAFTPGDDNHTPNGDAENRWSVFYGGTGAINTSDEREKTQITSLNDDHKLGEYEIDTILDAWATVSISAFKWIEMVNRKGEDARWHFGAVAQQVRDAFLSHGIDATKFGLLCYDKWDEKYETKNGKPEVVAPAGDRWGLRPDQCAWLEAAYQRRRSERLESRISALENLQSLKNS
ncbi:tail fiber domain-containing protein [Enterobacter pseudoroggenkampii]|uniref:Tail fiber domain-containing protein n=1 Tax=Enterobacter pseudoroggenkampii TaxID=2996112 RepID=A0ABT3XFZ7_9ENTR|nr:tail fiber domain-containing protein [Enterobacter pseudoroggenkampii]MCX8303591.1 tail fiber domain-containing protein [Enterobacter pseudoroggenkampii]